jgi:hypothetical protein
MADRMSHLDRKLLSSQTSRASDYLLKSLVEELPVLSTRLKKKQSLNTASTFGELVRILLRVWTYVRVVKTKNIKGTHNGEIASVCMIHI